MTSKRRNQSNNLARNKLNRKLAVAVVLIAITASIGSYFVFNLHPGTSSAPAQANNGGHDTVIGMGTSITVSDGSFRYIPFNVSTFSSLSGGFTTTEGITLYIVLSSKATSLNSHGVPYSYVFTTGHVSSKSFSTKLQPGSYDLMLANDNGYNSPSVVTFTAGVSLYT